MHSWERPSHSWGILPGRPIAESDGDADDAAWPTFDSESEDELPSRTPSEEFCNYLIMLVSDRTLTSKHFCIIMYFAAAAGIHAAKQYGLKPSSSSGHFNRKVGATVEGVEANLSLYTLDLPGHDKNSMTRVKHSFDVMPAHEQIDEDLSQNAQTAELIDWIRTAPPSYTDHPVVRETPDGSPDGLVQPGALYLDGVPYANNDSIIGVWIENMINQKRYLVVVLRKKIVCRCGCRGWCTLYNIFMFLDWIIRSLALGIHPLRRHDNKEWEIGDANRAQLAGKLMRRRFCIIYVKGDLSEYCQTLGFPSWNDNCRPCLNCNAFGDSLYIAHGNSILGLRWRCNEDDDYYLACTRCEHVIVLTNAAKIQIVNVGLRYDKTSDGSRGRCLKGDIANLGLLAGDRLEPTPSLLDVADFEGLPIGTEVIFWRTSEDTIARHRNPLFNKALGLAPNRCLAIDTLHGWNFGPLKNWCKVAIWYLLASGFFGVLGTAEENILVSLLMLRNALHIFYTTAANRKLTRVHDFTIKMLGTQATPQCKTKAAETFGVMLFLIDQLRTHRERLSDESAILLEAGECLATVTNIWNTHGTQIPDDAIQLCFNNYSRYMLLMAPYNINVHKNHQAFHLLHRIKFQGNPTLYAVWLDESLNKLLKKTCRNTSQYTFNHSVLLRMKRLLNEPVRWKRPRNV
jgi:hypothetical protein